MNLSKRDRTAIHCRFFMNHYLFISLLMSGHQFIISPGNDCEIIIAYLVWHLTAKPFLPFVYHCSTVYSSHLVSPKSFLLLFSTSVSNQALALARPNAWLSLARVAACEWRDIAGFYALDVLQSHTKAAFVPPDNFNLHLSMRVWGGVTRGLWMERRGVVFGCRG